MFHQKMPKSKVFLSRRNLLALLSKLDRKVAGDDTTCSIIKYRGTTSKNQQTMESIMVVAVDDKEYYDSQNREHGEMHPADEKVISETLGYVL